MKSILSLLLAIMCSTCIAFAETHTGTTGDCTYTLNTEDSTLVISGNGAMADYTAYSLVPYYSYASYVKSIVVESGVTTIGDYAFYGMTASTSISLSEGILTIGNYAFTGNTSRTSITLPESVTSIGNYAFQANTSLTSINIPAATTTIGNYAFLSCTALESLTFSEGSALESIGENAFISCKSLLSVNLPEGLTTLSLGTFAACTGLTSVTLPESLTTIGMAAFNSTSITEITIPASVTTINGSAFAGCSKLTKITNLATTPQTILSDTFNPEYSTATLYVTTPDYATTENWKDFGTIVLFGQCGDNLTFTISPISNPIEVVIEGTGDMYDYTTDNPAPWYSLRDSIYTVTMPDGITHIGDYAFYASKVTNLTIPSNVESIGAYAFTGCTGLTSITIPEGVTYIGKYAFSNACPTTVTIASTVETIDEGAFYWSTSLTSLTFTEPSSLTTIGDKAFYYCCYLTSLTLPESVRTIGEYAFYHCSALTELIIPEGVTTIGAYAFELCNYIETLTLPSTLTYIGDYAFSGLGSSIYIYNISSTGIPTGELTITVNATTPPTIFDNTFNTKTESWYYLYAATSDYASTEYWEDFKYIYLIVTTTVESVTITYGDQKVDVDELVETVFEYTVTYAQVDEEGNIIEGTETSEQPTEAGDYVIIYTVKEADATTETVVEIPLTIEKKNTDALSDIDTEYTTESGTVIDFEELVSPEDPDAEVTVTYTDSDGIEYDEQPTEPGEYTVTITIGDTDNINGDEIEITLTVTAGGNEGGSTAIKDVEAAASVNVVAGDIVIETTEALQVRVYSISGALAADTVVNGVAKFSVAKGTYIVVLSNGTTTKVLVK